MSGGAQQRGPVWEATRCASSPVPAILFAAWPLVYAASFSALYVPFMFLLFGLFLRRSVSTIAASCRSLVAPLVGPGPGGWRLPPTLVFGATLGFLLQGLPFRFDSALRIHYGAFEFHWPLLLTAWRGAGPADAARHSFCGARPRGDSARCRHYSRWLGPLASALFAGRLLAQPDAGLPDSRDRGSNGA